MFLLKCEQYLLDLIVSEVKKGEDTNHFIELNDFFLVFSVASHLYDSSKTLVASS